MILHFGQFIRFVIVVLESSGQLTSIYYSADQKGRSNMEFEEKFMSIAQGIVTDAGWAWFSDMDGVSDWILTQKSNNGGNFPTYFSTTQREEYLSYVYRFQQANIGNSYGAPVDPSLNQSNAFLSIFSKSNCAK